MEHLYPQEDDLVEILKSNNPYHTVGDIEIVWSTKKETRMLICPDSSGGAVHYHFSEVKVVCRNNEWLS